MPNSMGTTGLCIVPPLKPCFVCEQHQDWRLGNVSLLVKPWEKHKLMTFKNQGWFHSRGDDLYPQGG